MKRLTVLFVALALLSALTTPAFAARKTRTLALDLEFNGTTLPSQLTSGWFGDGKSVTKPVNGAETGCYSPKNVSVAGGYLDLRITAQSCTVGGHTYPLTAAQVTTMGKFTFRNAVVKARVFIDGDTQGVWNWPAFWTDGTGTWPHTGESDIAEGLSGKVCFHTHYDGGGPGGCPSGNYVGWHVFKEAVVNGLTTYFYDGVKVGQEPDANADQFIALGNQAGTYGGKGVAPADMLIDWLRVRTGGQ